MKIRHIETSNHPIFGDINFDFTGVDGNVINTIIIAGENGAGKTVFLDMLYEFSNYSLNREKREEKRKFVIEISNEEYDVLKGNANFVELLKFEPENNIFEIEFDYNVTQNWNCVKIKTYSKSENGVSEVTLPGTLFTQEDTRSVIKSIYSDVEINYNPQNIQTTTSLEIDQNFNHSVRSSSNIATEITQLLIDIKTLDALDANDWAEQNIGNAVDAAQLNKRLGRFTKAFNQIFPNKRFKGIINENNSKKVLFEEFGKTMSIKKLCSGEKQIVFRGGFLLKDKESGKGATILIDEPEISLHPNWQLEIMQFYKSLFTDSDGVQTSQIFVSTHSPFIIHNANRDKDKIIVLTKNEHGNIEKEDSPMFYSWGENELIKEAYNISYNLSDENVHIFLEGETDEKYFNKAKELFGFGDSPIKFQWIGRVNSNGNVEFTGDTALNHTKNFYLANSNLSSNKIVLLYDCDTNKPEETFEKLLIRKMPHNAANETFKIGVENLLKLGADFDKAPYYSERIKVDDYSAESINRKLNKTKLCDWICDEVSAEKQVEMLENVKNIIENIIDEVK